jgi:hypothetical protein
MPSPFPGMDPYLEDPAGWPDVHATLLAGIREALAALVSPAYHVRIEDRVYVTDPEADPGFTRLVPDVVVTRPPRPDEVPVPRPGSARITAPVVVEDLLDPEIHDRHIEIRDARSHEVVTVLELLSPANKVPGSRGRILMREKCRRVREAGACWIEIDLLRDGERHPAVRGRSMYCVLLLRPGAFRGLAWFFGLRDPLPTVAVPLRPPDPDAPLDLGAVLRSAYERARYGDSVDYGRPVPPPPLTEDDAAWARAVIETWRTARRAEPLARGESPSRDR